jgi:hypothetical protein
MRHRVLRYSALPWLVLLRDSIIPVISCRRTLATSSHPLHTVSVQYFFIGALIEVGPNNDQNDEACEVVSVINCRLP